jgi:nitrogen fixation protein NifU and related proteins
LSGWQELCVRPQRSLMWLGVEMEMDFKEGEEIEKAIQEAIFREMGDKLSLTLINHLMNPRNVGELADPDGEATLSGICEDTVRIQLKLEEDRIDDIRFTTNGCSATMACGSMVTDMARGRSVQEAMEIVGKRVIEAFGGMPIEHTHCADLAANTMRAALRDAIDKSKEPWKRLYRPRQETR